MHKILEMYHQLNQFGIAQNLDFKLIEPGSIEYVLKVQKEHLATPLAIHGGVLAALMDAVLGVAALSKSCESGQLVSTVEFKINYLAPVPPEVELLAKGKVIQAGKRIHIAEGNIYIKDSNVLVAKGIGTFNAYPLEKSGILEHLENQ